MKQIETEILINCNPKKVWNILSDFENHSLWNPFINSIKGEKATGETISVFIQPPGSKGMTFNPFILKYEENKELRWKGKFISKGIFDGEHYFKLKDKGNNQTEFIHGEIFREILVTLMNKSLDMTKEGFILMNKALKNECEKD